MITMKLFAFSILILSLNLTLAQPDFGAPELDQNILESKQYRRAIDYQERRNTNGVNGDWLRMQEWQNVLDSKLRTNMDPWENFGPDTISGRIISIDFHPTDPNTFLVGAAAGGLWETNDYGNTWHCLTDEVMTMGVGAVAYNPQNPNTILIATGEGYGFGGEFTQGFGMFISYDSGDNWNATALTATFDQSFAGMDIIWHPTDTSIVNLACSFGVYQSSDGGINYTYTLDRLGARMMQDPQNPDRLYFTARYYSATYPGGFYVSTDAGVSWTLSGAGLPGANDFGYTAIDVHPTYNHIVYLTVSKSTLNGSGPLEGLFKSTDYGQTFTEIPTTQDMMCYHPPYQTICQGWYDNTILIDQSDTMTLYSGGTRLWKSTDEGINWVNIDVGSPYYSVHPDHHQTIWHPLTGDLFDCNDGGVNFSSDGGTSWTNISNGLITHQFYSIAFAKTDPNVVVGGTQDVGTFTSKTAHSGGWNNDFSGDSFGHDISNDDAETWYATNFMNYQRRKTGNAGFTWFDINNGTSGADQWRMPIVVHPTDSDILMSANDNFIYKSTDAGSNWTAVAGYGPIGTIEWDVQNPDIVYAHDLSGSVIYQSIDGGDSWNSLGAPIGSPITDLAADPSTSGTVYATVGSFTSNNQVYVSYNAGLTWSNISNGLPSAPANTIAVSPYNYDEIYVGTDLGVWVSLDGGVSWQDFNDGLPAAVVVEDLHFYAPDTTIRIGTYGRGYWRTNALYQSYVELQNETTQSIDIFPNPSTGQFFLTNSVGAYQIFDQQGRLLFKGSELMIDLSNYPQGIYFFKSEGYNRRIIKI